jgi:hypothetical protein
MKNEAAESTDTTEWLQKHREVMVRTDRSSWPVDDESALTLQAAGAMVDSSCERSDFSSVHQGRQ